MPGCDFAMVWKRALPLTHLQIALISATDWYIFWRYEGTLHIILACVINFLVLLG